MSDETDCLANRTVEAERDRIRGILRTDRREQIDGQRARVARAEKALRTATDPERRETLQMEIKAGRQTGARMERELAAWEAARR